MGICLVSQKISTINCLGLKPQEETETTIDNVCLTDNTAVDCDADNVLVLEYKADEFVDTGALVLYNLFVAKTNKSAYGFIQ